MFLDRQLACPPVQTPIVALVANMGQHSSLAVSEVRGSCGRCLARQPLQGRGGGHAHADIVLPPRRQYILLLHSTRRFLFSYPGQVEMLFHEFGHALNSLLSRTEFQHLSGGLATRSAGRRAVYSRRCCCRVPRCLATRRTPCPPPNPILDPRARLLALEPPRTCRGPLDALLSSLFCCFGI